MKKTYDEVKDFEETNNNYLLNIIDGIKKVNRIKRFLVTILDMKILKSPTKDL